MMTHCLWVIIVNIPKDRVLWCLNFQEYRLEFQQFGYCSYRRVQCWLLLWRIQMGLLSIYFLRRQLSSILVCSKVTRWSILTSNVEQGNVHFRTWLTSSSFDGSFVMLFSERNKWRKFSHFDKTCWFMNSIPFSLRNTAFNEHPSGWNNVSGRPFKLYQVQTYPAQTYMTPLCFNTFPFSVQVQF